MAKKRIKTRKPLISPSIMATDERKQHDGGVLIETIIDGQNGGYKRRHRARFQSVLDCYLWHGVLTATEVFAGKRFHRNYARAYLGVRIEEYGSGAHGDYEMRAISAINGNQVLREAFALLSIKQSEIVISVCGDNNYAGTTRRAKYLSEALTCLAKHWKML